MSETHVMSENEVLVRGDVDNFVLLLDGLKESLARDRQEDEAAG